MERRILTNNDWLMLDVAQVPQAGRVDEQNVLLHMHTVRLMYVAEHVHPLSKILYFKMYIGNGRRHRSVNRSSKTCNVCVVRRLFLSLQVGQNVGTKRNQAYICSTVPTVRYYTSW